MSNTSKSGAPAAELDRHAILTLSEIITQVEPRSTPRSARRRGGHRPAPAGAPRSRCGRDSTLRRRCRAPAAARPWRGSRDRIAHSAGVPCRRGPPLGFSQSGPAAPAGSAHRPARDARSARRPRRRAGCTRRCPQLSDPNSVTLMSLPTWPTPSPWNGWWRSTTKLDQELQSDRAVGSIQRRVREPRLVIQNPVHGAVAPDVSSAAPWPRPAAADNRDRDRSWSRRMGC